MNKVVKKLVSFLFEEDAEVYAEDELEEVVLSKESVKDKKSVKNESTVKKESISMEKKVENQSVKKDVVEAQEIVQQKRFQSIDLQDVQEKTTNHMSSKVEGIKREGNRKEYEFSPVISPMFGAKDEPVRMSSNQEPTILKSRPKKRSTSVSTIISPMYGANDLYEDEDAEELTTIENSELTIQQVQPAMEEVLIDKEEISLDDEESDFAKSIPLEDLLQDEDNSNEDTMQISLFGEDTPVRKKENTTDYTIKE